MTGRKRRLRPSEPGSNWQGQTPFPKPGLGAKPTHNTRFILFYDDGGRRVCDTHEEVELWRCLDDPEFLPLEDRWRELHDAHSELIDEDTSELAQALRAWAAVEDPP